MNEMPSGFEKVAKKIADMLFEGIKTAIAVRHPTSDVFEASVSLRTVAQKMTLEMYAEKKSKRPPFNPMQELGHRYYSGNMPELAARAQQLLVQKFKGTRLDVAIVDVIVAHVSAESRIRVMCQVERRPAPRVYIEQSKPSNQPPSPHRPSPADVMKRSKRGTHHTSASPGYGLNAHGGKHGNMLHPAAAS